ncbi:MAG: HDIG domain-containing protein [Candidatus Omnitrophica bacterium]|nr:HDIG domain-containing protein [Candidatus Omnitrophota bacterium]
MKKTKKNEPKEKTGKFSTESFYRFLIFTLSFLMIVGIITYDPKGSEWKVDVNIGEPAPQDMYSPFNFTFIDEEETKRAKRLAADHVLLQYKIDEEVNKRVEKNITAFFAEIEKLKGTEKPVSPPEVIRTILAETSLKTVLEIEGSETFQEMVRASVTSLLGNGLISFAEKVELRNQNKWTVFIVRTTGETEVSVLDLVSLSEARDSVRRIAMETFPKQRKDRDVFSEVVNSFLEPNLVFDKEGTEVKREKVYKETLPVEQSVKKNEIVLRRGSIITYEEIARLAEIEKKIKKKKVATGFIGVGVIALFFIIILANYLLHFEPKLYYSLNDILLINTAIIFNLLLNKGLLSFMQLNVFLLPTSFAALLLAILIKPRIGFCIGIGMAVLSGLMTNYDPLVIITTLFASIGGVYMMLDVRRRSRFFVVGALVGVINSCIIFGFFVLKEMILIEALNKATIGMVNGFFITILLIPGLFLFEKLFDKTTSITLLELSDLNHPLLKRLIIEAPGTYHHSLVVSNLAESASEAIGANSLLARVGAYFHDIGKIAKAEYFTENQTAKGKNVHDNLTPRMSYFIITNHVKDGIQMATKYNLKKIIVDFIMQHHGTGPVYFFYKKALDQLEKDGSINITDFRYTGPKPQSKEIAITLLADSIEAASRALSEPTPGSLRGLVDKMINDKFLDNQLDECELTLLDLYKIKESFIRNLMAIFHTRVEYPEMINENTQKKKRND